MAGTLQIKNGKYYCVLDYRDEKGARKLKWISTGLEEKGNKRKATEMLNKIIMEYEQKEPQTKTIEGTSQSDILFTDYMKNWMERKKGKVEQGSLDVYYKVIYKHFIPHFYSLRLTLREIKPKHIVDYYDTKLRSGRIDGKGGLSSNYLKKQSMILKSILDQACLEELIDRNPAFKIPVPKKESEKFEPKFLNEKEANRLLQIFSGHHLQPIIYLTLCYGLRRGEVIGLKWSAIDFKNNKLKINHTITKFRY